MIKTYRNYVKQVTDEINKNPPYPGVQVTEQQVRRVLSYFNKNMIKAVKNVSSEVRLNREILVISPIKKGLHNYLNRHSGQKQ